MLKAPAADQEDRDLARLRLDANVVVEAGAGTGKTALLIDRILFLLLGGPQGGLPISSIVALTFTEKAAGEIQLRLTERLIELVALLTGGGSPEGPVPDALRNGVGGGEDLDDHARRRAQQLRDELKKVFRRDERQLLAQAQAGLDGMDQAQIGTIHAFASRLLRAYPVQAGVDPGFVVDEGVFFDELFEAEWAKWLDGELGLEAPRREEWLEVLRLASLEDLEKLSRELCRERLDLDRLGRPDPETAAWLEKTAGILGRAAEGQPAPRGNSKIRQSLESLGSHLKALAAAARAQDPSPAGALRPGILRSQWPGDWSPEHKGLYDQALEIAEASSAAGEALLRRACRILLPFARGFREGYTRRGFVSFDGLLRKARDLVRDRLEVRSELKRRYAALLIDEFQDTDPLQGELLLFLAEEEGGSARRWQEARPGPGRLFVVGDPKQSIYRFRGADIAAYQGFAERILRDPKALSCDLKTNFRSRGSIVGPVNSVFGSLIRYEPGLGPPYKPIEPERPSGPGEAGIELVCIGPPRDPGRAFDAETVQRREAEWIARWVLENCGGKGKRLYKDVAVLLRSSAPLGPLLEVFKGRDIPYAVEMEKYFYGAQEILDFLNLLRVLDDPGDRLSLAGLLRSPLAALEDGELYRLARSGALGYLREPPAAIGREARERLGSLFASLRRLRARAGRIPLGDFVASVLEETHLLELSARAYHGEQSVSNLLKLARMAGEASEERGMTLKEFIERAARDAREAPREGESPLADEHLDAVRVMTIHKAKGLEFPVVFFSNASGGRGGAGRTPVALVDWASGKAGLRLPGLGIAGASMAWLETREELRQEREAARLLYVAFTRAKERLFVLGKDRGGRSAPSSLLAAAGAWPGPDGGDRVELPGGAVLPVRRVRADERLLEGPGAQAVSRGRTRAPAARSLAALWKKRVERRDEAALKAWTMSPTAYLKEEPKRPIPNEERIGAGLSSGADIGRICHRVLEGWDFRRGGDLPRAVETARRALERLEPGLDWEGAARESLEILKGFLASPAARELSQAEIIGRELPFVYEDHGAAMRGSIDLLYRKNGLFVADYKTDRVTPEDLESRRGKYARQGAAYCGAVEKALGVKGVRFRLIFLRRPELS